MGKRRKDNIGKSVLARCAVICIAVVVISFSLISGLTAQGTGDSVNVAVNAPEYVEGTFNASVDVDSVADFNSGQFDLAFDSSVVNVTDVADGSLDGETIPVSDWGHMDNDTIRVILDVSGIAGVNGSGNLALISFEVVGETGDKSVFDISNGLLVNTAAEAIPAEWHDDEIIVGPIPVNVNAPKMVKVGETFNVTIDVDSLIGFNSGQFDLSFDSSVMNVTDVADGSLNGKTIPVEWEFIDKYAIRGILDVSGIAGISGSGNLATISFEVVGIGGDRSVLDIENGMLVNTEAEAIPAVWIDDEVIVGPIPVKVNAPEIVKAEETFNATLDVDNVIDFNLGQFDLSFNSSVVNVTDVVDGSLDGTAVSADEWVFVDKDTIRVILELPGITGVSGSGYLVKICFDVKGEEGDESVLAISNGILYNNKEGEIPVEWFDDKVSVL